MYGAVEVRKAINRDFIGVDWTTIDYSSCERTTEAFQVLINGGSESSKPPLDIQLLLLRRLVAMRFLL